MKIRMLGATATRMLCVASAALGLGGPASAELLNIDIEGDPPNDTTHSGADGVLSGAGSVWNGVPTGVDAMDIMDDLGSTTAVDVVFVSTGGGVTDSNATNDLQDSGTVRTFDVQGLSETSEYDVAIYAAQFSFVGLVDSTGTNFVSCTGSPTYGLPGTEGDDYCLFLDRLPADLGGGVYGFTVMPLDGVAMAVQIRGGGEPPTVPALPRLGMLGLLVGLLGTGAYTMRR